MPPEEIAALVTEGAKLDSEIKSREPRLKEIRAKLANLGAGDYNGEGTATAKVVCPAASLQTPKKLDAVRQLAGTAFSKLFCRTVTFKPAKGLREVAEALLTPASAKNLIALCEKKSGTQVHFGS